MRALLSILLAFLLLAQATFGLCWHKVDDCANCSLRPAVCSGECCENETDGLSSDNPAEPAGCRLECRGFCTFLPTQSIKVDTGNQLALDFVADIPSLVDGKLAPSRSWEHLFPDIDHAPPLRLHLLHQLLLI